MGFITGPKFGMFRNNDVLKFDGSEQQLKVITRAKNWSDASKYTIHIDTHVFSTEGCIYIQHTDSVAF